MRDMTMLTIVSNAARHTHILVTLANVPSIADPRKKVVLILASYPNREQDILTETKIDVIVIKYTHLAYVFRFPSINKGL
jgi:hypothetical protein